VDSGIDAGSTIDVYYDPMLAKVITWGPERETARKRMIQALNGYHLEGVSTNIDFANQVLTHPAFIRGELSTDFIAENLLDESRRLDPPLETLHLMAITTTLIHHLRENRVRNSLIPLKPQVGGATASPKRSSFVAKSEAHTFSVELWKETKDSDWHIRVDQAAYRVTTPPLEFYRRRLKLTINGEKHTFRLRYNGNFIEVSFCGLVRTFEIYHPREWDLARYMPPPVARELENVLECPMPGLIVEIKVKTGDRVFRGQEVAIIESMKMESAVASPCDGVIQTVEAKPGDAVETGRVLVTFEG
jgi:propionyl-CoA carboxylase alpha chain